MYVDDLLLASNSQPLLKDVKGFLSGKFEMADMGEPSWFLGLEIKRDRSKGTLKISQRKYVSDCLKKFGMEGSNGSATPIALGLKLEKETRQSELDKMHKIPYKQLVGSLIFLTCLTRSDIAFAVHLTSQFMACYGEEHWQMAKRVLRYLKSTSEYCITYSRKKEFKLVGFSDSDWAADQISRRSIGAYVFLLANGPVSWSCKKHSTVCLSSTEAEYKSLTLAAKECVWIRRCLRNLDQGQQQATKLYCNNQGAIALTANPIFHSQTKHIDIAHHFIHEVVAAGEVHLEYVHTAKNLADLLTKSLPSSVHLRHCEQLNLNGET